VRTRYLEVLASLNKEELLRDRGASYPSLLDIFVHVLDSYRFWILYVITNSVDSYADLRGTVTDVDKLRRLEREVGDKVLAFVEGLSEESIDRKVKSPWGKEFIRVGEICWHAMNEELQHRGEMNALLWQINIEPPLGTYDDWLKAERKDKNHEKVTESR
jgi:uncharacterized damage-inducible protein DinB